jgi:hypothetical protein
VAELTSIAAATLALGYLCLRASGRAVVKDST